MVEPSTIERWFFGIHFRRVVEADAPFLLDFDNGPLTMIGFYPSRTGFMVYEPGKGCITEVDSETGTKRVWQYPTTIVRYPTKNRPDSVAIA